MNHTKFRKIRKVCLKNTRHINSKGIVNGCQKERKRGDYVKEHESENQYDQRGSVVKNEQKRKY